MGISLKREMPIFYFMNIFDFLILIATTWLLSTWLTSDLYAGPFEMLDTIRDEGRNLSGAFDCIVCMSFWVGLFLAIAYLTIPEYTTYFCLPFALSASAIAWDKWNG